MIAALISDADGTLVDTVSLIRHGQYETVCRYMTGIGVAAESLPSVETFEQVLHDNLGGSAYDTLRRTVEALYSTSPDVIKGVDYDALHDMLNPIQDELAPTYVKAYDHLPDLLRSIATSGIKLGVLTSGTRHHVVRNFGVALPELGLEKLYLDTSKTDQQKMHEFIRTFRRHFGIEDAVFVTCDDVASHKPDPAGAKYIRDVLNVTPAETAMLGDHAVDIQCAENDSIAVRIGITHGFHKQAALEQAGATWVISSLSELQHDIDAGGLHL